MKIFIDKTEPIINNEITDRQTLLDVFLPPETFLQSVFLDVFNDETVEVQLCPLLDRFIQFDPGEKTPEDCPVSPGAEFSDSMSRRGPRNCYASSLMP